MTAPPPMFVDLLIAAGILVLVLALAAALVSICTRLGGIFAETVSPHAQKLASLEGLRGILALAVVAHHACCWFYYTQTAVWSTGGSILFERLASFGVMQFFFISGFLFWRKLIRRGRIDLGSFYLSRFVRLAPLYYACVGAAIIIGLSVAHLQIHEPSAQLAGSLVSWVLFSMGGEPSVNGADVQRIVSGVVWTLGMEWCFYLALPFLGWFSRKTLRLIHLGFLFVVIFFVCKYLSSGAIHDQVINQVFLEIREFAKFMLIGFGGGILVAAFYEKMNRNFLLPVRQRNWLLLAVYLVFLLSPEFRGFEILGWLCLLIGFALVTQETDLFGFITSRQVRFLGVISYDLYLVHGIVYYLAMKLRGGIHPIAPLDYILQTVASLIVIVLLATLAHFIIERPSMNLSERLARRDSGKGDAAAMETRAGAFPLRRP